MAISETSEQQESSSFRRIPRQNLRSFSVSGTRSTSSTRSATGCGSGSGNGSGNGGTKFGSLGNNAGNADSGSNMEYAWMEPPRHDPIATDTNLAEIDFEDFRNEDLAYAFSCGEDESGGSSADMSICRSEVLFSSMRDGENGANAPGLGIMGDASSASGSRMAESNGALLAKSRSGIQDSLMDAPDDFEERYGDQVKGNKNNYQLTYSRHADGAGSFYGSMTSSGAMGSDENNPLPLVLGGLSRGSRSRRGEDASPSSVCSGGKLTTWSNLGSKQRSESYNQQRLPSHGQQQEEQQQERWRSRFREENNNNNNNNQTAATTGSGAESRKSRSLPDMGRDQKRQQAAAAAAANATQINQEDITPGTEAKLVSAFIKNRASAAGAAASPSAASELLMLASGDNQLSEESSIPMMRSKDTVNHFLKTASRTQHLTSIEEAVGENSSNSSNSDKEELKKEFGGTRRKSSKATTPGGSSGRSSSGSRALPDLDFLENDVGLWDAFFLHSKNASKFTSVLKPPPLPVEDYLNRSPSTPGAQRPGQRRQLRDSESLRMLLPTSQQHLLPMPPTPDGLMARSSPLNQVCHSLSKLSTVDSSPLHGGRRSQDLQNEAIKSLFNRQATSESNEGEVQMVRVKEAWAEVPEKETVVMRQRRRRSRAGSTSEEAAAASNLNLINNNEKRRSYHPQDYLSRLLDEDPSSPLSVSMSGPIPKRPSEFPKSGSQNDLCDTWTPEEEAEAAAQGRLSAASGQITPGGGAERRGRQRTQQRPQHQVHGYGHGSAKGLSAEYPCQMNVCMQPQAGINFDLTHKRGLFIALYQAVERLLMYQEEADLSSSGLSASTSAKVILFHELCPALYALMEDGLKAEVITSFGKMETSVWRVIEAVIRQGPSSAQATCDLVMLLNTKFAAKGEDERKFAGFVAGLLNMSSLHIWYSKLKWSMDVLLRFYERHAFICALHKETRLLFDELIFCLQRLYAIPLRIDLPFSADLLEAVPPAHFYRQGAGHGTPTLSLGGLLSRGATPSSCNTSAMGGMSLPSDSTTTPTITTPTSESSGRTSVSKSRIPRPISLPKRLEAKLGASPSPVRAGKATGTKVKGKLAQSPTKPTSAASRKSRVRDTIRLFDSNSSRSGRPPVAVRNPSRTGGTRRSGPMRPRTGAGEAMANDSGGGGGGKT